MVVAGHVRTPARVGDSSVPVRERTFPSHPAAVAEVRRFVADAIAGFAVADDVVACASEVAANAVVHGSPRTGDAETDAQFTVEVRWPDISRVYVAVTDCGVAGTREATEPRRVEAPAADEHARGLTIVDELATSWGSIPHAEGGNCVWFEASAPSPANPAERSADAG